MRDKYISFGADFKRHAKKTRRAVFLEEMERIVPLARLIAIVEPHYPTGEVGRRPIRLDLMIRIHLLQQWYDLSDPGVEEALYDVLSMQRFAGIDLGTAPVPDETTICKFRHLLEEHDLGRRMFEEINAHLQRNGVKVGTGTIVDATIINAPSSTKNQKKERDPEMHSTRKGNQWYYGMKAHIGVDSTSKIVHTLETTAANVHDSKVFADLLHGNETRVWGDAAYTGQTDTMRSKAPYAQDFTSKRAYRNRPLSEEESAANKHKSSTRSRVEHIFGILKGMFRFRKVRYRGLAKNRNRLYLCFGLVNLVVQKKRILRLSQA